MNISQVSQKYGLSADTLRYYEKAGLIPPVHRTEAGLRDYQPEDCNWVEFIKCMRGAGLSIETLQKYVSLFQKGNKTLAQRKALLLAERDRIQAQVKTLQTTLKRLNYKINVYEEKIVAYEQTLHK